MLHNWGFLEKKWVKIQNSKSCVLTIQSNFDHVQRGIGSGGKTISYILIYQYHYCPHWYQSPFWVGGGAA